MSAQALEPVLDAAGRPTGQEGRAARPVLRLLPAPVREPAVAVAALVPEVVLPPGVAPPSIGTRGDRLGRPAPPVPLDPRDAGREATGEPRTSRRTTATSTSALPDPTRWSGQFVQAAAEVAGGLRAPAQLVRWTSEEVYATLARRSEVSVRALRAGRLTAPAGRLRVRSVRSCAVRDGVVESTAVVVDGVRARAVALRLEGLDGRWRVTALELG